MGGIVQPPAVSAAAGRQPQLGLRLPGPGRPAGGVIVRLWSRIQNPNAFSLDIDDLPGIAEAGFAAITGGALPYRVDATIGVDAGLLGRPVFGPSTLLEGSLRVIR